MNIPFLKGFNKYQIENYFGYYGKSVIRFLNIIKGSIFDLRTPGLTTQIDY